MESMQHLGNLRQLTGQLLVILWRQIVNLASYEQLRVQFCRRTQRNVHVIRKH